jgi:hypothetical protein
VFAASTLGGPIPGPLPILPPTNWWNLDISNAPVDPASPNYIAFIGSTRRLHPDFGGDVSPGSDEVYGFPYAVVDSTVVKRAVQFDYSDESDGVNHTTNTSFAFYPIPDEAISQPHWVEGGAPGNVDQRSDGDRHLLIFDADHRYLYELYNVFFDGSQWHAGSGAFFDLHTNARRQDGWTSADAAGLAILPGLVRYDEVSDTAEIGHAFRVTVRATNGYVYPASHRAGSAAGALPMGARLRLKASKDLSGFTPAMQRIFRAMQRYGLIVADNGSDMYVSGTYDTRRDNDILNPAFGALSAADFEVITLGYQVSAPVVTFTDDPLTAGVSGIRTQHVTELRDYIDGLRTRAGLAAYPWTDPVLASGGSVIRAQHILDLRAGLSPVYAAAGRSTPAYTDPALGAGTLMKAAHIGDIRAAVVAIE